MDSFERQNRFLAQMLDDYQNGRIPECAAFEPYFNWKMHKIQATDITREEAYRMIDKANLLLYGYYEKYPDALAGGVPCDEDDPWRFFMGFGDDKYTVSYLEAIDGELSTIVGLL